jgi:hypothetical protein
MIADAKFAMLAQTLDTSDGAGRAVLEKAKAQAGFIPNMYATMANSPDLLETYLDGYARFRADSRFTPVQQEVAFLVLLQTLRCLWLRGEVDFERQAGPWRRIRSDRSRDGISRLR